MGDCSDNFSIPLWAVRKNVICWACNALFNLKAKIKVFEHFSSWEFQKRVLREEIISNKYIDILMY